MKVPVLPAILLIAIIMFTPALSGMERPKFTITMNTANAYVDGGYVTTPDPVVSMTAQANWYNFYFRHWEMWDLSGYQSPEGSGRYNKSRKYGIEACNYVGGYTFNLEEYNIPLRISFQGKYSQYPHRRIKKQRNDGTYRNCHTKGGEVAMFIRSGNLASSLKNTWFSLTAEIDYQTEKYYWNSKLHSNLHYDINDKFRVGMNNTLYLKPSRTRHMSTNETGWAFTCLIATPYIRYSITEDISARFYVGFSAALDHGTRRGWRNSSINNIRNHWCGSSITWTF